MDFIADNWRQYCYYGNFEWCKVDFNSGVAHMELCAQKVTTGNGGTFYEPVEIEGFEAVLTNDIPFFAINK